MNFGGETSATRRGRARARTRDGARFRSAGVAAITALTLFISLGATYSGGASSAFADDSDALKGAPHLVWEARGEDKKLLEGLAFELQGPRDDDKPKGDGQWKDAPAVRVVDNIGQRDYEGLDEDPEPGLFLVKRLFDKDADLDDDVEDGATYRATPVDPEDEDVKAAEDAEWTKVEAITADGDDPVVVTVKPKTDDSEEDETSATEKPGDLADGQKKDDAKTGGGPDAKSAAGTTSSENDEDQLGEAQKLAVADDEIQTGETGDAAPSLSSFLCKWFGLDGWVESFGVAE